MVVQLSSRIISIYDFGTVEKIFFTKNHSIIAMIEDKNCIGCRVDCDGHIGTVKYVGTVGDTKGQWLGIDWDDPSRGKHNGTYEGVEYFQTWHPTSGSFIRPGKANFGMSCPEAIKVRYGFVDDELAGMDRETIASVKKSLNAPFVEMVGFSKVNKKQSTFDQLKIVCLHNQCVSSAGHSNELVALCPKVEELDLSHNLVNSWRVIADICVQLRDLLQLNVSQNHLPVGEEINIPDDAFISLSHLTMGRMKYDWCAVLKCLTVFPAIQELIVSYNIIQTIDCIPLNSNIMKVTDLSLENNLISDWNEVLKLGKLPCLRNLNLNSNKIQEIWFPTNEPTDKTALFVNLSQLHISDNGIENWRSVSELEKLKCLEELKFRGNPVLKQQSIQTGIQLVIARIATLKYLNGTLIERSERLGAEYDYLKLFASEWKNAEQDSQMRKEFVTNHPRFPLLIERIGVPDTPEIKNTQLSSNVITVEFICPEDPNIKRIKKKLLKNMDVQKLMGIVQRLFKIQRKIPVLSFVRPTVSEDEIPLDKPLQELSYYLIDDGDLILVRW